MYLLLTRVTGATSISPIGGVRSGGIRENYILKGGQVCTQAGRLGRRVLSGKETGRQTGTAGGRTDTGKCFWWYGMCVPTEGNTREGRWGIWATEKLIRFGTFNIRNDQNGGLELALRIMEQGQVDCGVFQETNLTKRVYARELPRQALTAEVLRFFTARQSTLMLKKSTPMA